MEKKNYYAIIPACVRYDSTLPDGAKLLYGEITALSNETGKCFAGNQYFADLYEKGIRTIQRWIEELKHKNYINVEIKYKDKTKQIENRFISIVIVSLPHVKNDTTPCQKCRGGDDKNVVDNNTYIYNTTLNITSNKIDATLIKMLYESSLSLNVKIAVAGWLEYKYEKKNKYLVSGFESLLKIISKKCKLFGDCAVIDLIAECQANNYQGIIWDKIKTNENSKPSGNVFYNIAQKRY